MPTIDRRDFLLASIALSISPGINSIIGKVRLTQDGASMQSDPGVGERISRKPLGALMQIHYLEIVTSDVEKICKQYSAIHGVTFAEPDPNLGGARTANLAGGGLLGVRGPLRDSEKPVVRPYILVHDIQAAVDAASAAGAEVALPPMKLKGHGTCAILVHGGIESGLWQTG